MMQSRTVGNYTITPLAIPEVLLIKPIVRSDDRGEFLELYKLSTLGQELGFTQDKLVQANISWSKKGVLRGMHYQLDHPQGKFVTVVAGAAFDAAIDIRRGSHTYGHSIGVELSRDNHRILWIPPGFAHGFLSLAEDTAFAYLISDHEYAHGDEYGIVWNDPWANISWPLNDLNGGPIIHERDAAWPRIAATPSAHLPLHSAR